MFPVLFKLPLFGGLPIYTYGVLIAVGFLLAVGWIYRESRRVGLPSKQLVDFSFYLIFAAVVGSRVFYALFEEPALFMRPLDFMNLREGGLVFHGGLIFAVLTSVIYFRRKKLNFWQVADVFMPALALGHAVGRVGCFMAGCCYGKPVDAAVSFLGVRFPEVSGGLAPVGVALYPTQLFEAVGEFLIFLILMGWRKYKKFDGQVLVLYFFFYSVLRFGLEFLRADTQPWLGLHAAQYVSLALFVFALASGIFLSRLHKQSKQGEVL